MWRDDLGSAGVEGRGGGWRLDAYGTWVWDEPSLLERPGIGTDAVRRASAGGAGTARRGGDRRRTGDRALAALEHADPTPIFHELSVDRSRPRREPREVRETRRSWRDRDAVSVPEPHPGSGPLPVQDVDGARRRSGLGDVPTVPPPAWPEAAASPEDELRRRAERRRRPLATERREEPESGRHTWRREEVRTGRHALRR